MNQSLYVKGDRYRVVKAGCRLEGMQPIQGGQRGWGKMLAVGDVLTCDGRSMTFGDGVPVIKWQDENGNFLANDCCFVPALGGMWTSYPDPSCLEKVP